MEQLSLLGLEPIPQAPPKPEEKAPPAQYGTALGATPVAPLSSASPVHWQHPQTNRQVVLDGHTVGYWFRRGQRRTIGFSVGPQGLSVSAPRWTPLAAVDAALQAKAGWVLRKLDQARQHHQVLQSARVEWADGTSLAWLGGALTVRLGAAAPAPTASALGPRRKGAPLVERDPTGGDTLRVALPATASPTQLRDAVQAWMMQSAHAHFVQRLDHFAPLLGVRWTVLKLSGAATRWGSAKADGSIRLHWRLMQFAPEVVDYVVAHELAHLRHMDHSDRFWQTVASVVPDYAALRARLKGERLPPW